jgi:hypothetical protein
MLFWQTKRLEAKTLELKSFEFFVLSAVSSVAVIIVFKILSGQLQQAMMDGGFRGDFNEHITFDERFGYSVSEVQKSLGLWGVTGRRLYLMFGVVDQFFFCSAYPGAWLVAVNSLYSRFLAEYKVMRWLRWLALAPVVMSLVDYLENTLQFLFTLAYHLTEGAASASPSWLALVQLASLVNRLKWTVGRASVTVTIPMAVAVAWRYFTRPKTHSDKRTQ